MEPTRTTLYGMKTSDTYLQFFEAGAMSDRRNISVFTAIRWRMYYSGRQVPHVNIIGDCPLVFVSNCKTLRAALCTSSCRLYSDIINVLVNLMFARSVDGLVSTLAASLKLSDEFSVIVLLSRYLKKKIHFDPRCLINS